MTTHPRSRILLIALLNGVAAIGLAGCDTGPPPPMVLNSDTPYTTENQPTDVVPVVGDLGGPVENYMTSGPTGATNEPPPQAPTSAPPPQTAQTPPASVNAQPDWRFSGALGATMLIPNVMVGWQGTGTGGAINTTFNSVQVMPTLELDVWHPVTNSGLSLGASGNVMFPFQGTNNKTVSNGTFSGTESYKQGLAGSAYFNVGAPVSSTIDYLSGTPHSYSFSSIYNTPQAFWFVGAGLAVDQYKASAVFPGAGDYFSATHTDVVPAFQAGITGKWPMGQSWMSVTGQVQDFLPGGTVTMPFGNAASYGTAKAGNTVGVTLKAGMPF